MEVIWVPGTVFIIPNELHSLPSLEGPASIHQRGSRNHKNQVITALTPSGALQFFLESHHLGLHLVKHRSVNGRGTDGNSVIEFIPYSLRFSVWVFFFKPVKCLENKPTEVLKLPLFSASSKVPHFTGDVTFK